MRPESTSHCWQTRGLWNSLATVTLEPGGPCWAYFGSRLCALCSTKHEIECLESPPKSATQLQQTKHRCHSHIRSQRYFKWLHSRVVRVS